jgi:hypothetical protein
MHLSGFDRFVWVTGFVGQIVLLFVLFARRRAASLPAFTAYIAIRIVTTLILYPIFYNCHTSTYQHWYWSLGILGEIFDLLVIYEIAVHVFCPTGVWARDVHKTFIYIAAASAVVALLLAWVAQPAAPRPVQTFILRSDLFSSVLGSELFVGMLALSSTVGLPWKTHTARIAQGLGAFSIVCVVLEIIANFIGLSLSRQQHTYTELSRIRVAVYLVCEAFWVVMLWAEAPAPRELPEAMQAQIYSLQRQVENDLIRIRSWRNN